MAGNEVQLYAAAGSKLILPHTSVHTVPESADPKDNAPQAQNSRLAALALYGAQTNRFDLLHNHQLFTPDWLADWQAHPGAAPVVSVLHTDPSAGYIDFLQKAGPRMPFIAFTNVQAERLPLNWVSVVNHGINTDLLRPDDMHDGQRDTALVLGRILAGKSTHLAIRAALEAGLRVEVAGKVSDPTYFARKVAPLLEQAGATFLGEISGQEKQQAYARAAVTICASTLPETFCLVFAESMACGTPVATLRNPAAREVVDEGVTGFVVDSPLDLAEAADSAVGGLDRHKIRTQAVGRFSIAAMAKGYAKAYARILQQP